MNKEEKEAIEILKEFKTKGYSILLMQYGDRNKTNLKIERAIETILNLIKKYEENYISKDVIRNKIEELNNKKEKTRTEKGALWGNEIYITDLKIQALKELLESEE